MVILGFYRFYASLCAGILASLLLWHHVWFAIACTVAFRSLWYSIDHLVNHFLVEKYFKLHLYEFKQQLGPYGIRIANKAESDYRIKRSLVEVFAPDMKKLQKNADQLKLENGVDGNGCMQGLKDHEKDGKVEQRQAIYPDPGNAGRDMRQP